jgi:hypothetical protein
MSKNSRPARRIHKATAKGWPLVVYIWMAGLGFLGYLSVRIALDAYPHPIHWLGGLVGALLGCGLGWLWYQRRGDIL